MSCDDILEMISSGERDVEGRPEFVEHLKSCDRCRDEAPALLAAVRAIRATPVDALAGHLTSDQIVTLAIDPEAAALDIHRRATEHLAVCPTCTAELQEVRRAEEKRMSRERPRRALWAPMDVLRLKVPASVALATGLGVFLLAYPAYLGLRGLPRTRAEMANLELRARQLEEQLRGVSASLAQATEASSRLSRWQGPVRLFNLRSPLRGETAAQSIRLSPGEPYVLMSLQPILEPSAQGDVHRFIIQGKDGRVTWSAELTAGEIRRQLKSSGALIFPVPSNLLAPGRHELRVLPQTNPQEPILQIPFEVIPAG
jgi:hypothetical protein